MSGADAGWRGASSRAVRRLALIAPLALVVLSLPLWYLERVTRFGAWIDGIRLLPHDPGGRLLQYLESATSGAALVWILLAAYAAGASGKRTLRSVLALALAGGLAALLKVVVDRGRPVGDRLDSWPSGHTAAVAAAIALTWWEVARWRVPLALALVSAGLLRVALGKHYPADVLAGLGVGIGSAVVAARVALPPRAGPGRDRVLLVLFAALLALPLLGRRGGEFFVGLAPGIWLTIAALRLRRGTRPAGAPLPAPEAGAAAVRGPAPPPERAVS